jgi:PAS domain S-box-containing protein
MGNREHVQGMNSGAAAAVAAGTIPVAGDGLADAGLLQAVLDASPQQIAVLDAEGRVIATNARWREQPTLVADLVSEGLFLEGRYLEGCIRERDSGSASFAGWVDGLQEVLAGKRQHCTLEYVRRADGRCIRTTATRCGDGYAAVVLSREDVTDTRRTQEHLARQADELRRLALVAERTSNSVAITDASRRILWVNHGFTRLTGYRSGDAVGRDLNEFLVCDRSDAATVANLRVSLRRGTGTRCELLCRDANGREYWTDLDVQPLTGGDGRVDGFIAVQSDITKQALLRQGLMASEQRLRVTIDSANLGLYDIDLVRGRVTYDASWARVMGYTPGEMAHLESSWDQLVHPDDRSWLRERIATSRARREPTCRAEYRARCKDGRWIWLHDSASVVEHDAFGAPIRVVGVIFDITDRKEAEAEARRTVERLSLAADAARLGVWDYDLAADHYQWDDRMREIYGITGRTTAEIKASFALLHPEDRAHVYRDIEGAMATGNPMHTQYRIIRADGQVRYLETWSKMQRGVDGRMTRSVGVTADITERVTREQDRQQSQRLESIGQLAAGIAHEINTPTQYIASNIRFLKDAFADVQRVLDGAGLPAVTAGVELGWLASEIPAAIEQSLDGIDRVAGIVRAMKDFSHPAAERVAMDLNRAIRSTIVVATNEWKYVADVQTALDADLPPVPVRPGEFNQVVLNLVVNAAHAIAAGRDQGDPRGVITVRTACRGGFAEVSVTDTGCGIPPELQARIFEPFFTTKPIGEGTGQGLAIARQIAARHGGTLTVESAPGAGSTFTLRLPLDPAAGESVA